MLTFTKPLVVEEPVLFYEGRYYMFSNFSAFMVDWHGLRLQTSEHHYQIAKFSERRSQHVAKRIEKCGSAHDAKLIAHEFEGYKRLDWPLVKLDTMEEILRAKLSQHRFIQTRLLETGGRVLVENSHKDSFWGRGPDWKGGNNLGKLWMKLRDELSSGTFHQ